MDIHIPNLGDGIESAIVISLLVKPGDTVNADDTLLELETDKAVAPVPAPQAGVIGSLTVQEGDTVKTGMTIGTYSSTDNAAETAAPSAAPALPRSGSSSPQPVVATVPVTPAATRQIVTDHPVTTVSLSKLAFRIGLDLRYIAGTGSGGAITEQDVVAHMAYLQSLMHQPTPAVAPETKPPILPLPDFSKWGEIEREACTSLRKKIADKMVQSWQQVPHVTQHLDIDITHVMALRKTYNPTYQKQDAKLTLTVFAIRAAQHALERFPQFNTTYDAQNNEIIFKKYINLGIAVDTPNGLIVPVIKDVAQKSLLTLCKELADLAQKAKDRTLSMDELQGGTFTLSNLGGLGVGAFTPIINTPEVAILGMGSGEFKPVVSTKKEVDYRLKMPVCLSYDHRVIDGADGARFVTEIKTQLESFSEADCKEL